MEEGVRLVSEQKVCLFYPAYYETGSVYLHDRPQYSGDYIPPVMSTLEDAPAWVRERVALINLLEPRDETPFGEWQPDAWEISDINRDIPIYRTYFIIVTTKTAQTWGKGWKKR